MKNLKLCISLIRMHRAFLYGGILTALIFTQILVYAQDYTGSFEFQGRNRIYEVYLPQDFKPNMPLVISLHGYTETVEWYKNYTLLHEVADTAGFITVYPAAVDKSWNSGLIAPGWPYIDTTVNDVGFISVLIDTLEAHYDIDMSRVYCCGYSLGGEMTYKLAGELGHRFAAVASVTGLINENSAKTCKPVRPFPIIHMHGTYDTYETWNGDDKNLWTVPETINFWLEKNGCTLPGDTVSLPDLDPYDYCTVEKISYTNCSESGCFIFYKIDRGGHHWPDAAFHWGGGNLNKDINANVEILNFFKKHENPLVNLAYAKSKEIPYRYVSANGGTLVVRAALSNPENHPASVFAFVRGRQSPLKDTLELFDDGLHDDGDAGDNLYGGSKWLSMVDNDVFDVTLQTTDLESNITTNLWFPSCFTTIGPVVIDNYSYASSDTVPNPGDILKIEITLKNNGSIATPTNIQARLISPDTLVSVPISSRTYGVIAAGEKSIYSGSYEIKITETCPDKTRLPIVVDITSDGYSYWRDTFSIFVQENVISASEDITEPIRRIYPNPTENIINFEIDNTDRQGLEIEVFNVTGSVVIKKEYKKISAHYAGQIDLSDHTKGIYLVKVRQANAVYVRKVVVR